MGSETITKAFDSLLGSDGGNSDIRVRFRGGRWLVSIPMHWNEPNGRRFRADGASLEEAVIALSATVEADRILAEAS